MPWIWWCLERCWDCNCAGLSSTWTQCGVQRLSHDQENGRDMTWPISPLDQIFYEHGVKMGTLTATKKGPVAASDVSGQDFGRWLTTWSHQAKPPQSLLGARTKSSRYWFVLPVVSFCCTLLNLQPPWPASTETLIQTYLIWTVTSMNFNVSLIWKLGENICVAPWICWTDAFTGFRWHLLTSLHCHLLGFGLDLLSPKEDSFALHETVLPRLALPAFLVNREWLWQDQACLYAKTLDPCALSQIGVVSDEALL